jgi:hypothetical protein
VADWFDGGRLLDHNLEVQVPPIEVQRFWSTIAGKQ